MTRVPGLFPDGMGVAGFLEQHWQKQPLLVRGAIPGFVSPLSPEELAGLACDEDVGSRLVFQRDREPPLQVRHGPFEERDFSSLPAGGWSLMVQEVDQLVPAVDDLLQHFRFVPNWRIDEVLASYAPAGAGIGAQVHDHDVFLFQGRGRQRWQVQSLPATAERPGPDPELRTPVEFAPDEAWTLEAGDMLYLPPRIAHQGVALDDSMTFTVGFAAPDAGDLFTGFVTTAVASSQDREDEPLSRAVNRRYADPDLVEQAAPGEVAAPARRRLQALLRDVLADERDFDRWLCRFLTAPHRIPPRPPQEAPADVVQALRGGARLLRSAVAHFAHARIDGVTYLYVGGNEHPLPEGLEALAAVLSGRAALDRETLGPYLEVAGARSLLTSLVRDGFLEARRPG